MIVTTKLSAQLHSPFPSRINAYLNDCIRHTDSWVQLYQLHSGADYEKYKRDNFGYMTARFYPDADRQRLLLANDIDVMLFVIDDALDHQLQPKDLIQSKNNLEVFLARVFDLLDHPDSYPDSRDIFGAIRDCWMRLKAISSASWQARFKESIGQMFQAARWEYGNVQSGVLPTVEQFRERRQFLGAAHISTDLIPVIDNLDLPEAILFHADLHKLTIAARNAVCFANDIFSLQKEIAHGDEHNIVLLLQKQYHLSIAEAIDQAIAIHNEEIDTFINAWQQLPSYGSYDADVQCYIKTLGAILSGDIVWSLNETHRYPPLQF